MENKTIYLWELFEELKENLRVKITDEFRLYLGRKTHAGLVAQDLNISSVSLRRKFLGRKGYSFKLNELLIITSQLAIEKEELFRNITKIKLKNGYWCNLLNVIKANKKFVEGVGYYIGDGRVKTNRGLSTVNTEPKIIRFFIDWLASCFNVDPKEIKIQIRYNLPYFEDNPIKEKWSKLLHIPKENINKVVYKHKGKEHHKIICEAAINRTILKTIFDWITPIIKNECLRNKELAAAYIRGIMAAEGSPKYHRQSGSRSVHLKMKPKEDIEYVHKLLKLLEIKSSIIYSKNDDEWIVLVSGRSELKKLTDIDVFKLTTERRNKFYDLMLNYKRNIIKKGEVAPQYINKLVLLEKTNNETNAPNLARFMNRDRTRVINVLRNLQKEGFLDGQRIRKRGRPFVFKINQKGKKLLDDFSKRFQLTSIPEFK